VSQVAPWAYDLSELPPPPPPALVVDQVCAAYGPYRALFGVSFTVRAAQIVALLGSNGAGKSTVARVVTGLLPVTNGRVFLAGSEATNLPAHALARGGVAHVPEGRGVFGRLTVEENLTISFHSRLGRSKVQSALEQAFLTFPILAERRHQRAGTLSGGQQRLLSLAKVLVAPPRLLVADELSLGLAPIVVDAVYEGLRQIHSRGTAIVVIEQQVERVLELASSAVVLEHGQVAFEGSAADARAAVGALLQRRSAATSHPVPSGSHPGWTRPQLEWRWARRRHQARDIALGSSSEYQQ
jgi:branched-chain amino acid transport system ATP-binding protein